jgi:hypothetical protein
MNKTILLTLVLVVYFGMGLTSGIFLHDLFLPDRELPAGGSFLVDRASPYDHIKEEQVKVYDDRVEILLPGKQLSWARFADSNSMDPVFDHTANSIEIIPQQPEDIHVGDIVAFQYGEGLIVHRVVEIGNDEQGWYALTAGDNIHTVDAGKRRFNDIKYLTIGILY